MIPKDWPADKMYIGRGTQLPYAIAWYLSIGPYSAEDLINMPYLDEYGMRAIRYWIKKMRESGLIEYRMQLAGDMRIKYYRLKREVSPDLSLINTDQNVNSTVI